MSAHARLAKLTAEKKLSLLWVLGLPRSNSTALHIALTQAPEVTAQLNEPFFHRDHRVAKWDGAWGEGTRSVDDGCEHILQLYDQRAAGKNEPLTLLIHDHAKDLLEAEFRIVAALSRHIVFIVRDPVPQALSLLTRLCNEMLAENGNSKISTANVLQMLASDASYQAFESTHAELLREGKLAQPRATILGAWRGQTAIAWENVRRYVELAKAELPADHTSAFDGGWLFDQPEKHLRALCTKAGLTYTNAMFDGWTKGVGSDFNCIITKGQGASAEHNAWNGPARTSTGIAVKPGSAAAAKPTIADMPAEIRERLAASNEIYRTIMAQ